MYLFLDESGDFGMNFDRNSSSHFIITVLVCQDKKTLFSIRSAVKRTIASKCQRKDGTYFQELKGSATTLKVKKYFYTQLLKNIERTWDIYSIIVDKKMLKILGSPFEPHRLYNMLSREIIERIDFSNVQTNIELFVDKSKGRDERVVFDAYLKSNLEPVLPMNVAINIEHKLSHDIPGLQAVDLFCHGISRKHMLKDIDWYTVFSDRIIEEVNWRPKLK